MKRLVFTALAAAAACWTCGAHAETVYEIDATASFSHSSDTPDASPPNAGSQDVGNGLFEWGNLLTDGSLNTAEFNGSLFTASDWGGLGTFTSDDIDVTGFPIATIDVIGTSDFNVDSEFFNFFYQLDDGTPVAFGAGVEDVESAIDESLNVDVSGATTMNVGFTFDINGSGDTVSVSQLSVTAVPEPGSFALAGFAGLGAVCWRRRKRR